MASGHHEKQFSEVQQHWVMFRFLDIFLRRKRNWQKYGPLFEGLMFGTDLDTSTIALETARQIRGVNRPPVIMLHGVMPRSGTNYIGKLLSYHPDLFPYPGDILEFPALVTSADLSLGHRRFVSYFPQNGEIIEEGDFHALFGAALVSYLYSFTPEGQQPLTKVPSVQYLQHFYTFFPFECLLLVLRDGRDVVASTLKTWPERDFAHECRRWQLSAQMIIDFVKDIGNEEKYFMLVRYEDVYSDPTSFIRLVCDTFDLNVERYPFDKITSAPIIGSSTLANEGRVTWQPKDKPSDFNPIGRWKTWPTRKKRTFKRVAGQSLLALGYCKDLDW